MKAHDYVRDFVLFILIIVLGSFVIKRVMRDIHARQLSSTHGQEQAWTAHEPDPELLTLSALVEQEIAQTQMMNHEEENAAALASFQKEVASLKDHILHSSPATLFLGPIGSAYHVLRENEIREKLQEIRKQLHDLQHEEIF